MRAIVIALAAAATLACAPADRPPAPTSVVNQQLGIALDTVPDGFTVTVNDGSRLELAPVRPDEGNPADGGRVWFQTGPEEPNVNLVATVHDHQAFVEAQPGGVYKGAQELGTQLGPAFYSRGRFDEGDGTIEETVIFALHPSESRRLELHYRYPAGDDSAARVTALIGVLAEVGAVEQPPG